MHRSGEGDSVRALMRDCWVWHPTKKGSHLFERVLLEDI